MSNDEAAIRAILTDRAKALYAKDTRATAKHLSDDFVAFSLAPPLLHRGGDRAGTEAWFATWKGPIGWENRDVRIAAAGDVAFATSLGHITGIKTSGEEIDLWTRCTDCFRKIDGEWKIVNAHTSVPFYMDGSYKAAVDLKP
jgi:ketosteroid isomerase-like protein